MSAENTDQFLLVTQNTGWQLDSSGVPSAVIDNFGLVNSTSIPTGTAVIVTVDRVNSSAQKTPTKQERILGVVSGNRIINCIRGVEGTAQPHTAGAVVEIVVSAAWFNKLVNGILIEHNQDGTHKNALPVGTIQDYAGVAAPTGFLLCDGAVISRTTYANLFNVIGIVFGAGDGSTTFSLPDARGRASVMKSTDTEFNTLGKTGGAKTHTLTGAESGEKGHNHTQNAHEHVRGDYLCISDGVVGGAAGSAIYRAAAVSHGSGGATATNIAVPAANADSAHNNIQPYITFNKIIKY